MKKIFTILTVLIFLSSCWINNETKKVNNSGASYNKWKMYSSPNGGWNTGSLNNDATFITN